MALENHIEGKDRSDGKALDSSRRTGKLPVAVARVISRFRWPILYAVTVAAMYWWYEIHTAAIASVQMHGTWQLVNGELSDERPTGIYWHVDKHHWAWIGPASDSYVGDYRMTVRPAENFFVVESRFPDSYGDSTQEFIVCLKGDVLYQIRGLARFDRVKQHSIHKLYRVDSLPDDVRKSMEAHMSRKAESTSGR